MACLYVFALLAGDAPADLPIAPDGSSVVALPLALGTALACPVSAEMVDRFKAAKTTAGLRAVTDWIVFHERMVKIAAETGSSYPFGFATLFSSVSAIEQALAPHCAQISDYFAHVAGAGEWAVKVCAKKRADTRGEDAAQAEGGFDYLRRRKARAHGDDTADAHSRAEAVIAPLHTLARDWKVLRNGLPPAPELEVLGTYAALVDHAQADPFRTLAEAQASSSDLVLTVTGPWPAFSFRPDMAEHRNKK